MRLTTPDGLLASIQLWPAHLPLPRLDPETGQAHTPRVDPFIHHRYRFLHGPGAVVEVDVIVTTSARWRGRREASSPDWTAVEDQGLVVARRATG